MMLSQDLKDKGKKMGDYETFQRKKSQGMVTVFRRKGKKGLKLTHVRADENEFMVNRK